jgi:hypothetical protein
MKDLIPHLPNPSSNTAPSACQTHKRKETNKFYSYKHSDDADVEFCYFKHTIFIIVWQVLLIFSALFFRKSKLTLRLVILLTIHNVKAVLGNNKMLISSVFFAALTQTLEFVPEIVNLIYDISATKNCEKKDNVIATITE